MSFSRHGSSPLIMPLYTMTFRYSTVASEEPSVGDIVLLKSDGSVKKADADYSERVAGVVISKNASEKVCTVVLHGVCEVTAGGSISVGSLVGSASGGKVKAIPDAGATYDAAEVNRFKSVIGKALTSAAADGDKVIVAVEVV